MQRIKGVLFSILPFLIGGAGYAAGGPVCGIGLFLLTGAVWFPVHRTGMQEFPRPVLDFTCPVWVRKWIYPVILFCGLIYGFFAVLQSSSSPNSWRFDTFELDLRNPTLYRRKFVKQKDCVRIFCNFTGDSEVTADGKVLLRTVDRQKFQSDSKKYYYDSGWFIEVASDSGKVTGRTPRKIVGKLSNQYWLLAILLLITFWSSLCECGLLPETASPVRKPDRLLLLSLLIVAVGVILCQEGQKVQPLQYMPDSTEYFQLAAENPVRDSMLSIRTPGYPVFLNLMTSLSPASHFAVIVVQYAVFFLALIWLLYELYLAGMPSVCCFALMVVFRNYMDSYHRFVMADSLGLSGIIMLLAFGLTWFRYLRSGCAGWRMAALYIAGALLIFFQLMIKPFPGTIFIPAGLVFLMFLSAGKLKTAFRHAVCFCLPALVLPMLFCGYRYWKTGDFNFASLVSSTMCAMSISLHDTSKTEQLPPAVKQDIDSIVSETLKNHPELKWPFEPETSREACLNNYLEYYWCFLNQPGVCRGTWIQKKNIKKPLSRAVSLELECRKILPPLLRCIDRRKYNLLKSCYLSELRSFLVSPPLVPEAFCKFSPFGRKMIWLLLICWSLALYCKRRNRASDCPVCTSPPGKVNMMVLLPILAFLGVAGIFSSNLVFFIPLMEVRREMIGLFSVFFGAFGLMIYSGWYLFVQIVSWGAEVMMKHHSAGRMN